MNGQPTEADRRVRRTREALRQALLGLLSERGWEDVSVQLLCDRANIGRSTFYMHFNSKEHLLEEGLDDLRRFVLMASDVPGTTPEPLAFLRGMIEHVLEQQKVFRAMIGSYGGHAVRIRFREILLRLVSEDPLLAGTRGWERDAAARMLAGALLELLTWLAETRRDVSARELETRFRAMAIATMKVQGLWTGAG